MQIQAYLVACVQNLKRLANAAAGGFFGLIANGFEKILTAISGGKFLKIAA